MANGHPQSISIMPIKERTRKVLIDLIEQWKKPYPQGLGEEAVNELLEQLVTGSHKELETMEYKDFMLLLHFIEERHRTAKRRERLAEEQKV